MAKGTFDTSNIICNSGSTIWIPKKIATIRLCGSLEFFIYDNTPNWVPPTPEQIENLKKLLCIEVVLEETNEV